MMPAAATLFWNAFSDDEFERYERRQRFIEHFAAVVTRRQAEVLGVVAQECAEHGHCALSIDRLADEAVVSRRAVHGALRAACTLGIVEVRDVIRITSPEALATM
jgi:hypothetical protein